MSRGRRRGRRAARVAVDHAAGITNDHAHAVVDAAAVGVAPLMRREAPAHTAAAAFLRACAPAAAMDQWQPRVAPIRMHNSDPTVSARALRAKLQLLPAPRVHADLAAAAAFAVLCGGGGSAERLFVRSVLWVRGAVWVW